MFQVPQDQEHMNNKVNYRDQSIASDKDLAPQLNNLQVQEHIVKTMEQFKRLLQDTLLEKKKELCLKN